jgi:hypothetical protein
LLAGRIQLAIAKPKISRGGPTLPQMMRELEHSSRYCLMSALVLWMASAKLWMLQCKMIGLPVDQNFETQFGMVKSALERRGFAP